MITRATASRLTVCLFFAFLLFSIPGHAAVQLGAGPVASGTGGNLLQVNGGIVSDAGVIGIVIDWGDGIIEAPYFPAMHRYSGPGSYPVTITGYDAAGSQRSVSFLHTVLAPPAGGPARVTASPIAFGLKQGETRELIVTAYAADGSAIAVQSNDVRVVSADTGSACGWQANGGVISVTAPSDSRDSFMCFGHIFVRGVEAEEPVSVIVNRNAGVFDLLAGSRTATYMPSRYFSSALTVSEYRRLVDAVFDVQNATVNGRYLGGERWLQGITYAPPVYGTNGLPLQLGDAAFPSANGGRYPLGVIAHELGHNMSAVSSIFGGFAIPGAFYQETIAEWYAQYTFRQILATTADLTPAERALLVFYRDESRAYHAEMLKVYIDGGRRFDYMDTGSGSHPLVELIYGYGDRIGWNRLPVFLSKFGPRYAAELSSAVARHGGLTVENKVTVMGAALGTTFSLDVRSDFRSLAFPLNDALYEELEAVLTPKGRRRAARH